MSFDACIPFGLVAADLLAWLQVFEASVRSFV
jgi:hypothetical protein